MTIRHLFGGVLILTVLRIAAGFLESPSPSEAYFYLCARQLDWAYFNGPPGTAALIFGLQKLTGSTLISCFISPLLAFAATLAAFVFSSRVFNKSTAIWTAAALNLLPIFNIAALRISPEMPTLCLVLPGMLAAWKAWSGERHLGLYWMASGLCFALAALFRYDALLIFPVIAAGALISPRKHSPGVLFGILGGLALQGAAVIGPLMWNAGHDWIPIAGGTMRTIIRFNPHGFFTALADYFYNLSPVIGALLLAGLGLASGAIRQHLRARFIFACAAGPAAWWLYQIARGTEDSTPMLLVAVPLMAWLFSERTKFPFAIPLARVALIFGLFCSANAMWNDALNGMGWEELAIKIQAESDANPDSTGNRCFFIAENPALASLLGYHIGKRSAWGGDFPPVFVEESQDISSQFAFWKSYDALVDSDNPTDENYTEERGSNPYLGRNAIYATPSDQLPQVIKSAFQEVIPLETHLAHQPGSPARTTFLFLCRNYQMTSL